MELPQVVREALSEVPRYTTVDRRGDTWLVAVDEDHFIAVGPDTDETNEAIDYWLSISPSTWVMASAEDYKDLLVTRVVRERTGTLIESVVRQVVKRGDMSTYLAQHRSGMEVMRLRAA